jgi:hypothetical protein
MGGVHWRTDKVEGLPQGEEVVNPPAEGDSDLRAAVDAVACPSNETPSQTLPRQRRR